MRVSRVFPPLSFFDRLFLLLFLLLTRSLRHRLNERVVKLVVVVVKLVVVVVKLVARRVKALYIRRIEASQCSTKPFFLSLPLPRPLRALNTRNTLGVKPAETLKEKRNALQK